VAKLKLRKAPFCCRLNESHLIKLKEVAAAEKVSIAAVLDEAVGEYIERLRGIEHCNEMEFTAEELSKAAAVAQTLDKPMPMEMLVEMVEFQRKT
jgi:hypothetical protein